MTIKEVQLYPTGGTVNYEVTAPINTNPLLILSLYDQNLQILGALTEDPQEAKTRVISGEFETRSYSQMFTTNQQNPTSLIVAAIIPSEEALPRYIPLSGPFPVCVDDGFLGKVVVTGVSVKGKEVILRYKYVGKNVLSGLISFRVKDLSHPDQRFEAGLGEKVGPAGSHEYMDDYQFSDDVSADQMVLQLPPQLEGTFKVSLRQPEKVSGRAVV